MAANGLKRLCILFLTVWMFFRGKVTSQHLISLVNSMSENAAENPYIVRGLETIKRDLDHQSFYANLQKEAPIVIPDVVTLAFVLETLTSSMVNNWKFLRVCYEIWSDLLRPHKVPKLAKLALKVYYYNV